MIRDIYRYVDVGGGIGSTAMLLAHTFPHLRFVVQDRPQVAEHGVAVSLPLVHIAFNAHVA